MPVRIALVLLAFLVPAACGRGGNPEPSDAPGAGGEARSPSTPSTVREIVYDREFLFVARGPNPPLAVPWFFRSRAQLGGVQREHGVWVFRENAWEPLVQESSSGPTTRAPWRILPSRDVRVIVGDEDAVETLVLHGGAGEVETRLLQFLFEWARPDGESVRLFEGRTTFPSGPTPGFVLDISRRWEAPLGQPGDWLFLTSGSGIQIFFEEVPRTVESERAVALYRGWVRSGTSVEQWSDLTVRWDDMRPFERARRDVPYRWILSSADDFLTADLASASAHLATGESDGPILPVSALFGVTGNLRIGDDDLPVTGILRHSQR